MFIDRYFHSNLCSEQNLPLLVSAGAVERLIGALQAHHFNHIIVETACDLLVKLCDIGTLHCTV